MATVAHKETAHYAAWRDAVAPMMAQPRTNVKYGYVFDTDHALGRLE
jgi:autoinducer 2-degrading protein